MLGHRRGLCEGVSNGVIQYDSSKFGYLIHIPDENTSKTCKDPRLRCGMHITIAGLTRGIYENNDGTSCCLRSLRQT